MLRNLSVEVGQVVYVAATGGWVSFEKEPSVEPYTVTKVNGSSFYAQRSGDKFPKRFDRRTWVSSEFGFHYRAYVKEEDFWERHNSKLEHKRLVKEIQEALPEMTLLQLQNIANNIALERGL